MKNNEWLITVLLIIIVFLSVIMGIANTHSDDRFWAASDSLHANGDRCLKAASLNHLDSLKYYEGKMDAWFEVEDKEQRK